MSANIIAFDAFNDQGSQYPKPVRSPLPSSTKSAISSTIAALHSFSNSTETTRPLLLTTDAIFVSRNSPPPAPEFRVYLEDLANCANVCASAMLQGSLLAGQTSESDEYGDAPFWLGKGDFSKGNESAVLQALAIDLDKQSVAQINEVKLSARTHLPVSCCLPTDIPETRRLFELLSRLRNIHAFSYERPGKDGVYILYFLVGRLETESDGDGGWVGLIGVGIWS